MIVPYSSIDGSLMYAMICTQPNIAYVFGLMSRFLLNLSNNHWDVVKWILRYLRGSSKIWLCFGSSNLVLEGCTNIDMTCDFNTRKLTFGYVFTFSEEEVSWQSKLQKCIALSTIKIEYIAIVKADK